MDRHPELSDYGVDGSSNHWRVARKKFEPMNAPPPAYQGTGRFDDAPATSSGETGNFGVLYCGETPYGAFLETLYPYRRRLEEVQQVGYSTVMEVELRDGFMERNANRGLLPRDWMEVRQLVNAGLSTHAPVFDLANAAAVQVVREHMALTLLALGHDDLDFANLLGRSRDVTQAISRWIWSLTKEDGSPLFSGIRYRSRFDPECICLALYEGRFSIDGDIDIQPITPETPGFAEAANILRLQIA